MKFAKTFVRTIGGIGTVLGTDAAPTTLPIASADNQFEVPAYMGTAPITGIAVGYTGPALAADLVATLYTWEESLGWLQCGSATIKPGRVTYIDKPVASATRSTPEYESQVMCLVVAAAGGDAAGTYRFGVAGAIDHAIVGGDTLEVGSANGLKVEDVSGGAASWLPLAASLAAANSGVIKNSAGKIYGGNIANVTATDVWFQLFDAAAVPADATAPRLAPFRIPANDSRPLPIGAPLSFATGICWSASTTGATKTITATNPLVVSLEVE